MLKQFISKPVEEQTVQLSKRLFTATILALPLAGHSLALSRPANTGRELSFYHTHTGKSLSILYHDGTSYLNPALQEINQFLSDFRSGEVHPIDTRLLDALYLLQKKTGSENSYEIISAYRSPKTNAKLRNKSNGVAKRSLHMQGKAVDIRLRGINTKELRNKAIAMKVGGVGYYRRSDFIHLDTGRVRYW